MTDTATVDTVITNEVIITLNGRDIRIPMASLSLNMESGVGAILDAVRPVIRADENVDIQDERGDYSFTVRKAVNSNTIYVYPKPVAGAKEFYLIGSVKSNVDVEKKIKSLKRGYNAIKNDKDSKVRVKYISPKDPNDKKRIGQKLIITKGKKTIKLNGTQMRSLDAVLFERLFSVY